jgi:hypothetical protein
MSAAALILTTCTSREQSAEQEHILCSYVQHLAYRRNGHAAKKLVPSAMSLKLNSLKSLKVSGQGHSRWLPKCSSNFVRRYLPVRRCWQSTRANAEIENR